MKKSVLLLLLIGTLVSAAQNGMAEYTGRYGVEETTKRLVKILREKGVTLFKVIDHSEGAAAAGMKLRPTKLVIFGNPKIGTPLMQCSQTLGLDLPQKMLIYEDENGSVHLVFNTKAYLMWRHDVSPDCAAEYQKKMDKAVKMFAKYAAGKLEKEESGR